MNYSGSARVGSAMALVMLVSLASTSVAAQTFTDFEDFTTGVSVDGQGGWSATNPNWDEEVVQLTGNKAWRVSNEVTSGSFGDQPIAKPSGLYAGESGSTHVASGNPAVTDTFYASFDIWPVVNGPQPGLDITVSPDDGQGSRQSFLSIEDNGSGIDIDFYDTDANHPVDDPNGGFRLTEIATGLTYDRHTIAFEITFVDGNVIDPDGTVHGNDVVNIYIDGELVHTGTTWESYFWTTNEGQTEPSVRAVDTLLFRLSTDNDFDAGGAGGFYIDNVLIDGQAPAQAGTARFTVSKTFSNGASGDVEVTLTCNGGTPLQQSFTIAGGGPGVTFTVQNLPDAGADCAVTESGSAGYTADLSACAWTGVTDGDYSCAIENVPEATMVSVDTTVQGEDDPSIDTSFTTTIVCENVSADTGPNFDTVTEIDSSGTFTADWYADPVNGTDCTVTMVPNDMAVEGDSCSFSFAIGDAEAGCDVAGTVFFEGIPTLSQYGMALMALLMLGIGFVGLRRFV